MHLIEENWIWENYGLKNSSIAKRIYLKPLFKYSNNKVQINIREYIYIGR